MTLPPQPDANPQRSATRAPVEVDVRVQFDDSLEVYVGHCYNISIGGLFLEIDQVRPHGSLVRFEVGLPEGSVRGLAEVVWSQQAIPGRAGGLGLKFRFLEQRDRQQIFKLVSQHIKERLAQRPSLEEEPPPSPNTPLARQRRASLLGEGIPSESPPALSKTSSIPRPAALSPEPQAPIAPRGPEHSSPRFPSTPDAEDLVVRTGASALPILADPPAEASPSSAAHGRLGPPRISVPGRGLEERTWPSARPIDPAWLTPDPEVQEPAGPLTDLPLGGSTDDLDFDRSFGASAPADPHPFDEEAEELAERRYFDGPMRPRAAPRKRLPWILAPILLVLALLGYFLGTRLWHRVSDEPQTEVLRIGQGPQGIPPAPVATPQPTPPAATPTQAPERDSPPPASQDTVQDQEPIPDTPTPSSVDDGNRPTPSRTETTPPQTPSPSRDISAEREDRSSTRGFARLQRIRWEKIPDGVEVFIEADGPISADRFDRFRLEGATPREVIRFYGVDKKFEQEQLGVGSIYLQQIRLGWHPGKPRGNELHVVLDVGTKAKIHQIRNLGRTLAVQVKKL